MQFQTSLSLKQVMSLIKSTTYTQVSDEAVLVGYILPHMNTLQTILEYFDTENAHTKLPDFNAEQ